MVKSGTAKKSKKEIAADALERAHQSRKSGYKSVVFLPELAAFKEWLDEEISKGDKSANSIAMLAKKQFPDLNIPSAPTIKNYMDKHYVPKQVVAVGYSPKYLDYVAKFDTYLKLLEAAQECWSRYLDAKNDPRKKHIGKGATWFDKYTSLLQNILEIEIKLGIRNAIIVPKMTLNQLNIGTGAPGLPPAEDIDQLRTLLKNKEIIDSADARIRAYAATRS